MCNDLLLHTLGLTSSHFARRYYGNLIFALSSIATKIFQFTMSPTALQSIQITCIRFPHSEILEL